MELGRKVVAKTKKELEERESRCDYYIKYLKFNNF